MNTVTVRCVTSRDKIHKAFVADSDIHGYTRISGNARRGTYLVEVREGKEEEIWLPGRSK